MKLDWYENTGQFVVRVPRSQPALIQSLMNEHGLSFSQTASTSLEAVCFTDSEFAAVTFFQHATERAKARLISLHDRIEASWKASSEARIRCPEDLELWPYQRAGVSYALQRQHTLIGDQPGLGKTMQAICFANEIRAKKVLIICPASIRLQWAKKVREWSTLKWPIIIHTILHSKRGVHPNAHYTIVSYELAASPAIGQALARQKYDLLVLDEAHYLKTVDARRTRAVFGGGENRSFAALAERSARILALTGTPLPNRPREAYTLARGLCFDSIDWMSEDNFNERFNPSVRGETTTGKVFVKERSGRGAELQNRLRSHFMVRREKHGPNGVMPQLHMPIFDLIHMQETKTVKAALEAERLLDIDPETLEGADMATLGHIAVVRRQMGIAVAPQVADWVDDLMDGGEEKLVVFCWHIEVLNILEKRFLKHGVVRIDGSTSTAQREIRKSAFIKDKSVKVIIGNMLSMGVGLDGLQAVCSHGIIAEPDWTLGNNIQAFDRLDRGGQAGRVQGDIVVVPGSIAERVLAAALRKGKIVHQALDQREFT